MFPGVAHQFHPATQTQLGHQVGPVSLDGAHTDVQNLARLAIRVPSSDEAQYLDLAWSQWLDGIIIPISIPVLTTGGGG